MIFTGKKHSESLGIELETKTSSESHTVSQDLNTSTLSKTQDVNDIPQEVSQKKKQKKERLGKCQVCGQNKAKARCIKCGKPVCTSCYFHLIGVCKKCLSKHTGDKWKGHTPDWEKTLGVEWID